MKNLFSYLQENGYKPTPLDLSNTRLNKHMEELVELLAENTHNVWAKDRIKQGWTYGLHEVRVRFHFLPNNPWDDPGLVCVSGCCRSIQHVASMKLKGKDIFSATHLEEKQAFWKSGRKLSLARCWNLGPFRSCHRLDVSHLHTDV